MLDDRDVAAPDAPRGFAETLRTAIVDSGLTLDEVRRRLAGEGVSVSAGSLSHWQTGRSAPRPTVALPIVDGLERVLGLEEGSLRRLVPDPRPRGRGTTVRDPRDDVARRLPHWAQVRSAAAILGLPVDDRVRSMTVHEIVDIGADRRIAAHVVRVVVRAAVDPADRLLAYYSDETPHHELPRILARRGCRVGGRTHHPEAGLAVVELVLPAPLAAGARHLLEYEVVHVPTVVTTCDIRHIHALREAAVSVRFPDARRPARVLRRVWVGTELQETEIPVDADGVATVVRHGVDPGMLGLRWEWPQDRAAGPG